MKVNKRDIKNSRRGRPAANGAGQPTFVRLHRPMIAAIDYWKKDSDISRPEAIRQLLDWALLKISEERRRSDGME